MGFTVGGILTLHQQQVLVKKGVGSSGFRPISWSQDWHFGFSSPYSQIVPGSFLPKNAADKWDNDFNLLFIPWNRSPKRRVDKPLGLLTGSPGGSASVLSLVLLVEYRAKQRRLAKTVHRVLSRSLLPLLTRLQYEHYCTQSSAKERSLLLLFAW